jgi:hypothetical protein
VNDVAYTKNQVIDNLRVQRKKLEGQIDAIKTVCKENQGELAREILGILGSSVLVKNSED